MFFSWPISDVRLRIAALLAPGVSMMARLPSTALRGAMSRLAGTGRATAVVVASEELRV